MPPPHHQPQPGHHPASHHHGADNMPWYTEASKHSLARPRGNPRVIGAVAAVALIMLVVLMVVFS